MERATVHVLVVDDIEQWRDAACTMVHSDPRFFVVGVASDGAEAVRKAKALRPNIVLLDMNLPDLHGIEVARIIAEVFATLENHLLNARSHQRFDRRRLPRWGKRICSQIERGPGPYACAQRAFL
jgi:DNA-binding NarL/FixJ family response regulator